MSYKNISFEEAKKIIENEDVTILDVRSKMEYIMGHIKNAVLISSDKIKTKSNDILTDKNKKIIVYCLSGGRSSLASMQLKELGYKEVYNLGVISNWKDKLIKGL